MAQGFAGALLLLLAISALIAGFEGTWMLASGWLLTALLLAAGLGQDIWMRGDAPVALVITATGGLAVVRRRGSREPVTVASGSLFLGSGAMLVLSGERTCRVLLGRGNVKPHELALLRRLLRGLRA